MDNRVISGQIHKVSRDYRILSIQIVDKLEFFYLPPRFVKQFRKYLYPGVFVAFSCDEKKFKMKHYLVSRVVYFEKIIGNRYHRKFSYFDQKIMQQNILDKLSRYEYRLFLDLEMTLQRSKNETEEIVQIGYLLTDKNDEVIETYNEYIRPTKIESVSQRTLEFLSLSEKVILTGRDYFVMYEHLKTVILRYKPAVIAWGNNDWYALDKSYDLNRVAPLIHKSDYINLQQVHKEYFNVNNELGLFKTASLYGIECGVQMHNAFTDAEILRFIFNKFYHIAYNDLEFDFKQQLVKIS